MYKLITEIGNEPLSLTDVKSHIRVDHDEEDDLIMIFMRAAREKVEAYTNRKLVHSQYALALDTFPDTIEVKPNPVISVDSIVYSSTSDVSTTLASGVYSLDTYRTPSVIYLNPDQDWPETNEEKNNVVVTYTVGYANAEDVPANAKAAILFIVGFLYEHRQAVSTMQSYEVPLGIKFLLDPLKIMNI